MTEGEGRRGVVAWFAENPVAANLVMLVLVVGGLLSARDIAQEVFPEVTQPIVLVEVEYPGASPEEVEQGVVLAIEDVVRGLDGVKEVRSIAAEGVGIVSVELLLSADEQQLLNEVESAVARIVSFPADAEEPVVSLLEDRQQVISLILYGTAPETSIRELAERAREALIEDPRISYVELSGVRPLEISVEVPREQLRRYGLTPAAIADRVRETALEIPGGEVETEGGEILVRTSARRDYGDEIADIVIVAGPEGSEVRLRDIATVTDGLADTDELAFFEGAPAARVDVYRVGDEKPLEIAEAARAHAERLAAALPEGVRVATWGDASEIFRDRIDLLLRNGYLGLGLVLLILGLFLSPRLAFWVTLGIPVSFLGALLLMPIFDVSINIISLFAFIVTLGLVVDDAIVVGESIQYEREHGVPRRVAAARGARLVSVPVVLAVATTCVAFAPMLFVPGPAGELFRNIPLVVILVLCCSLIESLLVVPAHLAHPMPRALAFFVRPFFWAMERLGSDAVTRGLGRFVQRVYVPAARRALAWRYLTVALAIAVLLGGLGLWLGARIQFEFLPRIEGDEVSATIEMPVGTRAEETRAAARRLEDAARRAAAATEDGPSLLAGVYTEIGGQRGDPARGGAFESGAHLATVQIDLGPAGERATTSADFVERWRAELGPITAAERLSFELAAGASRGPDIDLEVSHPDLASLNEAADELARAMSGYAGVRDVDSGVAWGKEQLDFALAPEGRALGLTEAELASQLRGAFFGAEALRVQRGRTEVRVYVRLPASERGTLETLEELLLRTPEGGEIPLFEAARVTRTRAETAIQRARGRRVVHVTADVSGGANANEVVADLAPAVERLGERWPGARVEPAGPQESQNEALASLGSGFAIALVVMFALLALAFRSYSQPLVVMFAIPLGAIGAVAGHLVLGYDLSISSMMGLVALAGVVVNDSLLFVTTINEHRASGAPIDRAIVDAGARRFRPILLTSLTTFMGLAPMIFEPSVQARFLIPMALSLGFGVLLATPLTLLVVPCLYRILVDVHGVLGRALDRTLGPRPAPAG